MEYEPHSPWFEFSIFMAFLAVQRKRKTEYHTFSHTPEEVTDSLSHLGMDVSREVRTGSLRIIDSHSATTGLARPTSKRGVGFLSVTVPTLKEWSRAVRKQTMARIPKEDKGWFHIDDNTSLILQYNTEESFFDNWRTAFIPWGRSREMITLNAIVPRIASDAFYRKLESLYDGIIDLTSREGESGLEHYVRIRSLHGAVFDSSWQRFTVGKAGEIVVKGSLAKVSRRLAAIMFTDMAGYTALMNSDEDAAMKLRERQECIVRESVGKHGGRVVKALGDGLLIEFGSAMEALQAGLEIQRKISPNRAKKRGQISLRISLHAGDIVAKEGDVFGDAVNIASRLNKISTPGEVWMSGELFEQVSGKLRNRASALGKRKLKGVRKAVEVFRIALWAREPA